MKAKLITIITLLLLFYGILSAQTIIECGRFSGVLTREDNPYIIVHGDGYWLQVCDGDTLIIEPGVIIYMSSGTGIGVYNGRLIAEGTQDDSIRFVGREDDNWMCIQIEGNDGFAHLAYCLISGTYHGDYEIIRGALMLFAPQSIVTNCTISDCRNGLCADAGPHANIIVTDCYLIGFINEFSFQGAFELVERCIIVDSYGGMRILEGNVSNCLIFDCGYGVFADNNASSVSNCIIIGCEIGFIGEVDYVINNCFFGNNLNFDEDVDIEGIGVMDCVNTNDDSTDQYGNLFMDPLLVGGDDFPDKYFIQEDSPCIDAGDPTGDPDPDSTIVDIGPFFFPQCNISVEPESVEFNDVQIDYISEAELEISSVGLEPLEISWLRIMPDDAVFDLGDQDNHLELPPDSSHTLMIYFYPLDEGEYEAVLLIESNDRDEGELEIPLVGTALGVELSDEALPTEFAIMGIYPNPFNSSTEISYSIPQSGEVSLKIYDIGGRLVKELVSGIQQAGTNRVTWNGLDGNGLEVASGVYLYRISFEFDADKTENIINRMVLIR